METRDISKFIDYTLLKPDADSSMFEKLCSDAVKYGFYSVCVPPYAVKMCKEFLKCADIKIVTVIGFPLGYASSETKAFEIKDALSLGADEVDAVINVSAIKSGDWEYVKNELTALREAAGKAILKIIIETCYLSSEEIVQACAAVSESGADFVKTSTGFGSGGAKLEDIELIKKSISPEVKIKASGAIKTYGQAAEFLAAGVSRIGTSSVLSAEILIGKN
jgi:deoxyribose-phosphate aldolase